MLRLPFDPNAIFSPSESQSTRMAWESAITPQMSRRYGEFTNHLIEVAEEAPTADQLYTGPLIDDYHGMVVAPLRQDIRMGSGEDVADAAYYSMLQEQLSIDGITAAQAVVAAAVGVGATAYERRSLLELVFVEAAQPTTEDLLYMWARRIRNAQFVAAIGTSATIAAAPFLAGKISALGAVAHGKPATTFQAKVNQHSRKTATETYNRTVNRELENSEDWDEAELREKARDYRHKEWVSRNDDRVREAHAHVDGQVVPIESDFNVGGVSMSQPGDTRAPLALWLNCRCTMIVRE